MSLCPPGSDLERALATEVVAPNAPTGSTGVISPGDRCAHLISLPILAQARQGLKEVQRL